MGGNIRKSGVGHGGNGIAVLLRQQTGEDSGGLRAGHAAAGAEGPVCVAQDIGAVTLSFLDFRNGQLAVLIRLALGRLAQVTLNNDVFILLRIFLVVGDGNRHTVVFIQIRAIRQFDRNIAGLTDGNLRVGDGASGIGVLHLDGQRPAVAVRILIASSDLAALIGLAAAGGNGDLARGVGLTGGVVIILVCNGNAHARYSALVLDQLHGGGGLICVVQ